MSKKEIFMNELRSMIAEGAVTFSEDALAYFNAMSDAKDKNKPMFTEIGRTVVSFMRDEKDSYNNLFKSKDFEAIGITSRRAAGAMRKLEALKVVSKEGENPCIYSLTSLGEDIDLEQ